MKHRLNILFLLVATLCIFIFTSCSNSDYNCEAEFDEIKVTATTITVTTSIKDPDDIVYSPYVCLINTDGERVKKQDLSDIPATDDSGVWESETEKFSSLDKNTTYTLELCCTIGEDAVTLLSQSVSTDSSGSSEEEPIEIDNETDLYKMIDALDAYYKLTADIELDSSVAKSAIFNSSYIFDGTLDGNGHTISGFYETESVQYSGLFGYLGPNALIKNLTIENANIAITRSSVSSVGVVAGYCEGNIENVTVKDSEITFTTTSTTNTANIGGFVGEMNGGSIKDSKTENSSITLNAKNIALVGGFVGTYSSNAENSITNSIADTDITVTTDSSTSSTTTTVTVKQTIGGFVGENNGYISSCASTGDITSTYTTISTANLSEIQGAIIGGFAGYLGALGRINNVLANGSISFDSKTVRHLALGLVIGEAETYSVDAAYNLIYKGTDKTINVVLVESEDEATELPENRHIYLNLIGFVRRSSDVTGSEMIEEATIIEPTYTVSKFVTVPSNLGKAYTELSNLPEFITSLLS